MVCDRVAPLSRLIPARCRSDPAHPLPDRGRRHSRRGGLPRPPGHRRHGRRQLRRHRRITGRGRRRHDKHRRSPSDSKAVGSRDAHLAALAERANALEGPEQDKKLALLIKTVKQLLADGYHPIVFCRYIPTSEYLAEQLDGKLGRKTIVACVNGTLSPAQRLDRIERLAEAAGQEDGARRVLVATDCLAEGVNLQHALQRRPALRPHLEPDQARAA